MDSVASSARRRARTCFVASSRPIGEVLGRRLAILGRAVPLEPDVDDHRPQFLLAPVHAARIDALHPVAVCLRERCAEHVPLRHGQKIYGIQALAGRAATPRSFLTLRGRLMT